MDAVLANITILESLGALRGSVENVKMQQKKLAENSEDGRILLEDLRQSLEKSKFRIEGLGIETNQRYQSSAVWMQYESDRATTYLL